MKRLIAICTAALALASLTAVTAGAVTTTGTDRGPDMTARVLYDCATSTSGRLSHRYSVRVLRIAQREMPRDVAEYTGCNRAIEQAIRASSGTIVAGVAGRRGRLAPGRVTLLHGGRAVDVLALDRGELGRFRVIPGRYTLKVKGRRCSKTVRASEWRTTVVRLSCRR